MIRVGVVGYGVIGRRVADAISAQPDMDLIGIIKTKPDYKAKLAISKGFSVYSTDSRTKKTFVNSNIQVSGELKDLLNKVDVVVDAVPSKVGVTNRTVYQKFGKKVIYQGGESSEIAEGSFVAQCNYEKAEGKRSIRVVSCNTTGLCRILNSIDMNFGIELVRAVIIRRATDPDEPGKGIIDAVSVDPIQIPSHHGPDVNTVLPNLRIITTAIKIPTTHLHLHTLIISLKDGAITAKQIIKALNDTTRIILISSKDGFKTTGQLFDYARELGRWRSDLYELAVWKDSITIIDKELYLHMGVAQEAIAVPENIDAIRAISGGYTREKSISITNSTLNILQ
jgi:glyceraldehyde-3-phosphate dehydrogenase (NAD(P))|tara:strand:+ start:4901 stop:5917 length:1017 start_codon:yes stop_codon:yes gene_type:complete